MLSKNELAFRFETNDTVGSASLGVFLAELSRIAKLHAHFGPDAEVRILELGVGSVWGKIAIFLGALGGAAGVGSFALDLSDRMKQPTGKIAEAVAAMCIDSSVVCTTIVTNDGSVVITSSEILAIDTVEQKRLIVQTPASLDLDPVRSLHSDTTDVALEIPRLAERWLEPDFSSFGDRRGARNYLGRFQKSETDDYELFKLERAGIFAAKISSDSEQGVVFNQRVMVRAEVDRKNRLMFVHEIYPLEAE